MISYDYIRKERERDRERDAPAFPNSITPLLCHPGLFCRMCPSLQRFHLAARTGQIGPGHWTLTSSKTAGNPPFFTRNGLDNHPQMVFSTGINHHIIICIYIYICVCVFTVYTVYI